MPLGTGHVVRSVTVTRAVNLSCAVLVAHLECGHRSGTARPLKSEMSRGGSIQGLPLQSQFHISWPNGGNASLLLSPRALSRWSRAAFGVCCTRSSHLGHRLGIAQSGWLRSVYRVISSMWPLLPAINQLTLLDLSVMGWWNLTGGAKCIDQVYY